MPDIYYGYLDLVTKTYFSNQYENSIPTKAIGIARGIKGQKKREQINKFIVFDIKLAISCSEGSKSLYKVNRFLIKLLISFSLSHITIFSF